MMKRVAAKKPPILMLAFIAISGCTHHVETRVTSEGIAAIAAAPLMRDNDRTASSAEAQRQVSNALAAKGFSLSDHPVYHLEVAWSARPATLALGSDKGPDALAKGKKSGGCKATEYRLGVTLTSLADGQQAYHATAAEYHCETPEAQVLPILVAAVITDIGAPRGEYVVKRKL